MRSKFLGSLLLVASAASVVHAAPADDKLGLKVRLSYGTSGDISLRSGGSGRLEGPELGLIFPILRQQGYEVSLEPSLFWGGRIRRGSDVDGDVYRFLVTVKKAISKDGFYLRLGTGFSQVVARAGAFDDASGVVGEIGFGLPVSGFLKSLSPNFEVRLHTADSSQLRGIFVGLTGSF